MRKLVMIFCALAGVSAAAAAGPAEPQVVLIYPDDPNSSAMIIPAGTALRVASLPNDGMTKATFSGRLTLTGAYELKGYGDDAYVTLWPDSKSQAALPYWRDWWEGAPTEIYLDNGWAFAQTVVGKNQLRKLKADDQHAVRGKITIIVDQYETSIECDHATYSARFVSVVGSTIQLAANQPEEQEGC